MHHHAWEDWLLQELEKLGTGRESEGQRRNTVSSMGGTGGRAGHSNDNELGQVVGKLLREGTESPRAGRKVAPVMLFLSQSQSLPFPEMLAVSLCNRSL